MSENTKWMPSVMEVVNAGAKFSLAEGGETIEAVCRRTGLRAQIEVLEELIAHMRSRYTSEANPTGSYCNQESLWIGDKIQKLRREIEG